MPLWFCFSLLSFFFFFFGKTIWFCVLSFSRKWIYFHIVSAKLSTAVALIHSLTVGKSWPVLGLPQQIPTCDQGRQIPMYQVTQVPTSASCPLWHASKNTHSFLFCAQLTVVSSCRAGPENSHLWPLISDVLSSGLPVWALMVRRIAEGAEETLLLREVHQKWTGEK